MDDNNVADVYYVDTRNADHRATVTPTGARPQVVIAGRQPAYQPAAAPRVTYAGPAYNTTPANFAPNWGWGSQNPVYMQPPVWGAQSPLGSIFGGLNGVNVGTLIDLIGQGFAAIRSLPTAPTSSGDSGTDVANLTLYQQALAEHGKSDEQIRTAVHIIAKLLGA
jgi:hypothetical protein